MGGLCDTGLRVSPSHVRATPDSPHPAYGAGLLAAAHWGPLPHRPAGLLDVPASKSPLWPRGHPRGEMAGSGRAGAPAVRPGRGLQGRSPPGPWTSTPIPSGGPEATAAAGDQGSGALRLRLEGTAHERLCGRQDLPTAGKRVQGRRPSTCALAQALLSPGQSRPYTVGGWERSGPPWGQWNLLALIHSGFQVLFCHQVLLRDPGHQATPSSCPRPLLAKHGPAMCLICRVILGHSLPSAPPHARL